MDILLAILLVLVAWYVFKSLTAVILVGIAVLVMVWVVRSIRGGSL